ncbi:MAG: N-acetyltransferase [Clostridia bacterium]|nr:N-acetyltransferase [Clostridia bacterium]
MNIRKAGIDDLAEALRIYAAAREYMSAHGNPTQWGKVYPPEELVRTDIEKGNLYLCCEGGEVHGVFAFIEGTDPTYAVIEQGEWPDDKLYNVMHRMASDGKVRGIGKAALDFCKANSGNVRADTHRDNITMQNMLAKNGFVPCGIIHVENGSERIAYQYTAK